MSPFQFFVCCFVGWLNREQQAAIEYLREEVKVLREIHGKRPKFNDRQRRRLAVKAKKLKFGLLKEIVGVVSPYTLLRWHKSLIAKKYDSSRVRRVGRPNTHEKIRQLVVRMSEENERWGYTRIRDAVSNLGHEISRNTVANILKDHGIEPSPERGPKLNWSEFLKRHWEVMAATDFFTVEVWSPLGLVRYHVMFVIRLATREVKIAGVTSCPDGHWTEQLVLNLTDGFDGFLNGSQFLIHDRDSLYTKKFGEILKNEGIESVRLPVRSPNLNAFAERFVRSIKLECLDRMIFFSERSLRLVINEYVAHYHEERNHQGLEGKLIRCGELSEEGQLKCNSRIGGLLNYYYREAA